jgi:2,3-bisphosphoglycerate-dependent phosphoglycerate mutase
VDRRPPLWRLNERHYGALQGKDKKQTLAELGEEQFMLFAGLRHPAAADRARLGVRPGGTPVRGPAQPSCCRQRMPARTCVVRMLPYWYDAIVPDLRTGATVLVTAHGQLAAGAGEAPGRLVSRPWSG